MKKQEYIESLVAANTEGKNQELYADIIDCVDIALSQEGGNFEITENISLQELYGIIESESKKNALHCVGPFEAAELFAKKFGASYTRVSRRSGIGGIKTISLEDFL